MIIEHKENKNNFNIYLKNEKILNYVQLEFNLLSPLD
jgi:hypothetical protein